MRFVGDRRGQSVVIGTVILFGFLILTMAVYQAQVVPQENADVEFEHSQSVEGDFVDLRNAITGAGTAGDGRSTSVQLGTRYPQRTFFVNPPPATGELSTSDPGDLRIEGASIEGGENVEAFWENQSDENGNLPFDTRSVRYSPHYNEFRNGPDLVYEHSLVAAEFDGAVLARTGQTAVRSNGTRLSLTMIDGDLSESSVERRSFDPETLSQQQRTVTLQPDDGNVTLVLPTTVETAEKREALAGEWESAIDGDVTTSVEDEAIRVEIETDDSVRLGLSQVGFESEVAPSDESDGYITKVSQRGGTATAEVRDRYNNPVEGAEVTVTAGGSDTTRMTDDEGRVQYSVESGTAVVRMDIVDDPDDPKEWEEVDFGEIGQIPGSPGEDRYVVEWLGEEIASLNEGVEYADADNRLDINRSVSGSTITTTGRVRESGRDLDGATVDFASSDPGVSTFPITSATTDQGDFDTSLDLPDSGDATLFAASGDGVDSIDADVFGDPSEAEPEIAMRVDDVSRMRSNDPQFYVSYDISTTIDEVEVSAESTSSEAGDSVSATATRNGVLLTTGDGQGQQFEITVEAREEGSVVGQRTIVTNADTYNPSDNDDMSRGDSALLDSSSISDSSQPNQNNVRYRFSYSVSPTGSFSETGLYVVNRNGDGATGSRFEGDRDRQNVLVNPGDGTDTIYKVAILVFDADGVVVDDQIEEDEADGNDPA